MEGRGGEEEVGGGRGGGGGGGGVGGGEEPDYPAGSAAFTAPSILTAHRSTSAAVIHGGVS